MADSNNIDKALTYLGTAIKGLIETPKTDYNIHEIIQAIPKRSFTGDHLIGGTAMNFASQGIKDEATSLKLTVKDDSVHIESLTVSKILGNTTVENTLYANTVEVTHLKATTLEVTEIKSDSRLERSASLEFKKLGDESLDNKGLWWVGEGYAKQFVFKLAPDRLFSTEHIDLIRNKHYAINNVPVLSSVELGNTVIKSNLREVGRLKGLIVDGSVSINQYLHYNAASDRLGLGIEEPNAGFSVAEDGIEVMLGARDQSRGIVGTYASNHFDIVAGNTTWISISPSGNIKLGNSDHEPIQVTVNGKLAIKVAVPDPDVDLHVNGPIRFHGHLHFYANEIPVSGSYRSGDIIWNTEPKVGKPVGWVCTHPGNPGQWNPFGQITT